MKAPRLDISAPCVLDKRKVLSAPVSFIPPIDIISLFPQRAATENPFAIAFPNVERSGDTL